MNYAIQSDVANSKVTNGSNEHLCFMITKQYLSSMLKKKDIAKKVADGLMRVVPDNSRPIWCVGMVGEPKLPKQMFKKDVGH